MAAILRRSGEHVKAIKEDGSAELILPDDMLVLITQDVDSLAPVLPALAGLCFRPAAKLTILLGDVRRLSAPSTKDQAFAGAVYRGIEGMARFIAIAGCKIAGCRT
ncbi:MAG: hypothetical protein ACLQAH_01430 [Limisphaerales bacterium]